MKQLILIILAIILGTILYWSIGDTNPQSMKIVTSASAAELPWTTSAIAKMLSKSGFTVVESKDNVVWVRASGPVFARIELGNRGKVNRAGVAFTGKNMEAVYAAMVSFYTFMQADMGKYNWESSEEKMLKRMRRLEDTIAHNLKLNNNTTFTYDDFRVSAWKDATHGYIVIEFEPAW